MLSWRLSPNLSKAKIMLFPPQPEFTTLIHANFPNPTDIVSSHKQPWHCNILHSLGCPTSNISVKNQDTPWDILSLPPPPPLLIAPSLLQPSFFSVYLRPVFDYADTSWAGLSSSAAALLQTTPQENPLKFSSVNPACSHHPLFINSLT